MKKIVKATVSLFLFGILFVICGKFLDYILVDDTSSYTRITFHEMYEQDNIDVLFVGSSHCYRSVIPEIMDKELGGINTFNAGTSGQLMDGSYMVIREAAKYNHIQHIYLEVYYEMAYDIKKDRKDRTVLTSTYIISDYLRPSLDKIIYLLKASDKKYYVNSFIPARRNWSKLYDLDYMTNLVVRKNTSAYKNYEYDYVTNTIEWYGGKGYVAHSTAINDWNFFTTSGWDKINVEGISEDYKKSLSDIIDFCEKNEIKLTFIVAPMSNYQIEGCGNYDEYVAYVKTMTNGTSVDYFDFNLCKEEYFPNTSELFKDAGHLNCYGAEIFSRSLAKLINGEVKPEDMFYASYEEKIENLEPTVFGVSYQDTPEETGDRNCKIVSTQNQGMEYQVSVISEEGEECLIRDYSPDIYFAIPQGTKGTCVVKYQIDEGEVKQVVMDIP